MGAAGLPNTAHASLRHRLLLSAACGLGLLTLAGSATAQTIGNNQTVNVSTIGSGTPNFEGGTLVVDKSGTYSNNFVLGGATSTQVANLLDAHGNQGVFS